MANKTKPTIKRDASPETIEQAHQDYIAGVSSLQIAEKYGHKVQTVCKWISRNEWKKDREKANKIFEETFFEKCQTKIIRTTEILLDITRANAQMAYAAQAEIYQQEADRVGGPKYLKRITELSRLASMTKNLTAQLKDIMPSAPIDVMEKILEELDALNQSRDEAKGGSAPLRKIEDG